MICLLALQSVSATLDISQCHVTLGRVCNAGQGRAARSRNLENKTDMFKEEDEDPWNAWSNDESAFGSSGSESQAKRQPSLEDRGSAPKAASLSPGSLGLSKNPPASSSTATSGGPVRTSLPKGVQTLPGDDLWHGVSTPAPLKAEASSSVPTPSARTASEGTKSENLNRDRPGTGLDAGQSRSPDSTAAQAGKPPFGPAASSTGSRQNLTATAVPDTNRPISSPQRGPTASSPPTQLPGADLPQSAASQQTSVPQGSEAGVSMDALGMTKASQRLAARLDDIDDELSL